MQDFEYDDLSETVKAQSDIVSFAGKIITVSAVAIITACIIGLILK